MKLLKLSQFQIQDEYQTTPRKPETIKGRCHFRAKEKELMGTKSPGGFSEFTRCHGVALFKKCLKVLAMGETGLL
jgi:hypothetical protein